MKIAGIDFPRPLLDALRDGKLVIFAGAGVSMGKPANLPNFRNLAMAIAQGAGEKLGKHETEDRVLGRLRQKGVNVHDWVKEKLSRNDPKPTDLHRDLLKLYSAPRQIRVITTNFDLLFEQAVEVFFNPMPEAFRAPALPLGHDFNGIRPWRGQPSCGHGAHGRGFRSRISNRGTGTTLSPRFVPFVYCSLRRL